MFVHTAQMYVYMCILYMYMNVYVFNQSTSTGFGIPTPASRSNLKKASQSFVKRAQCRCVGDYGSA